VRCDGGFRVALPTAEKLSGGVLSFGSGVRVLKLDSLREAVRQEAQRIAAQGE